MNHPHLSLALAATLAVLAGPAAAQGMKMPMQPKPASAPARSALPVVDAEVRRIEEAKGQVTLKHGDIPNLGMTGMTMVFDVADKSLLKGVRAGDKVRFQADMVNGKATVLSLEKAR